MGMWDTFRNALGLTPPLRVAEPGAFVLSEAARETVAGLGDDRVLFIQTTPLLRDDGSRSRCGTSSRDGWNWSPGS